MSRVLKERLKTICLWSYQNQGTPIRLLFGLFRRNIQISDEVVRERLFVPDRLILSDGDKVYWVVPKGSEHYGPLWNEAFQGLRKILSGSADLKKTSEDWGSVSQRRGYMIDFGYALNPELVSWFLGIGDIPPDVPDIRKVMVRSDIVDESMKTYYIYGSDNSVFISGPIRSDKVQNLDPIIKTFKKEEAKYRQYVSFIGSKIDKVTGADPDVLYVVTGDPKYWSYYDFTAKAPVRAENDEVLANILLGAAEMDRYNRSTDAAGTRQFNYSSNIYRYHQDGYLSYRYLGNSDSTGKGDIGAALPNAYKFVARISELNDIPGEIVLTSVKEIKQGIYEVTFDYRLSGMPVRFDVKARDGKEGNLSNAITIQVSSKRVLKCDWLLKDLIQGTKGNYNDRLMDLLDNIGLKFSELSIQELYSGYLIDNVEDQTINPMLLIRMKDQRLINTRMIPQKGD